MPTNPTPINYPFINGLRWDFTSIVFFANGVPLPGLQSIDYTQELKAGEIYAASTPQKIGSTRGQLKCTCSFDILALEYENFITALCALNGTPNSGYMEVRFDIQVQRQDGTGLSIGALYTDVIRGTKMSKVDKSYKLGPEGLVNKIECDPPYYIIENGQLPVGINAGNLKFNQG